MSRHRRTSLLARLRRPRTVSRKAAILVIFAVTLPVLLICCALATDVGVVMTTRSELQSAADSAALAAAARILEKRGEYVLANPLDDSIPMDGFHSDAQAAAAEFAGKHKAGGKVLSIRSSEDVNFFYVDPTTRVSSPASSEQLNSVVVTTRRDTLANAPLQLFFANVFGFKQMNVTAEARATFFDQISRIGPPPRDRKSTLMPFAIKKEHWDALLEAQLSGENIDIDGDNKADIKDALSYSEDNGTRTRQNGIPELRMFPGDKNDLTAGNFGTVDIGGFSESTDRVKEQILNGPTGDQISYHDGGFDFSEPFTMSGDPGISAGMKGALNEIIGEARTIFLYSEVEQPGSKAAYTIIGFVGIRVMAEDLTGSPKGIWIEPAPVEEPGAIEGGGPPNYNVYGPVHLTQ